MRRVVVTGLGMLTPLGNGVNINWQRLISGQTGIKKITSFDVSDISCQIAGQIPLKVDDPEGGLNIDEWIEPREQKRIDRFIAYGIVSAIQAIEDSGWKPLSDNDKNRTGVILGSGIGGLETIAKTTELLNLKGPRKVSPFFIPSSLINLLSGQVSIKYGFKGPNHSVVTACSTGAHAIGDASRIIRYGDADVMVAGGAEAACCRIGMAGFAAARALSTNFNNNPTVSSRPWDKDRDGFVMGEGSGVLVLEEREHAIARGANIYAEVKGYGMSGDAYHITAPSETGDGGFRAMQAALKDAKLMSSDIDYINAHGTSTPLGDMIELRAIGKLLQENIRNTSISSTKSATGHLLGAAGAIEAIYSILAIVNQIIPPTNNLLNPDNETLGFDLVPIHSKKRQVNNVLSNSFGFGGTNASLLIGNAD
jgi:3-oxoacyl-[acyl-carrier-protein] synthase II